MKPKNTLRTFLALAGSSLLAITYASAGTYYWDSDGDGTAGFGSTAGTWDAAGTGNLWSTSPTGDGVGGAAVADYPTTTSDNLFFGSIFNLTNAATTSGAATVTCDSTANLKVGMIVTGAGIPTNTTVASITDGTTFVLSANATATSTGLALSATLPFAGAMAINGTVNANYIYQSVTAANFTAGTSPVINFSAEGTIEIAKENWAIGAISITGAGTSLRWKNTRNTNATGITSCSAAKVILSTADASPFTYPGRFVLTSNTIPLGAIGTPLEFDRATIRMNSGFPYSKLSTLHADHPVSFVANKDAGLENNTGATFELDQAVNLGTGFFFVDGGVIKATQANTWGGVKLTGGTLEVDNQSQLGTITAPLRFGTGSSAESSGGTLRILGATMTSLGARPMLTTPTKGVGFDIADSSNTFTVDQLLDQTTGGFTKAGAGTLTINTTSSYTGTTTVSGGTLNFAIPAALPTGAVTVNGTGALLQFDAYNPSVGLVTLTNGSVTGSGTLTSSAIFTLNGAVGTTVNVGIKLSGTLGLTKSAAGTATLSADNSGLSGPVTISSTGVLNINSATALGTGAVTWSGGTIDATSGPITLSTGNPITLGGNVTFGGTNALNLGTGAITMAASRTFTLNGTGSTLTLGGVLTHTNPTANSTLTANGPGNTLVISGGYQLSDSGTNRTPVISGTGNVIISGPVTNGVGGATTCALTKTGTGTLTLNGDNTYDGLTTHSTAGSTLTLAGDNSGAAGGLTMNNATAVLNINSNTALGTGTTTLTAGIFDNTSGSPKTTTGTTAIVLNGNTTYSGTNNLTLGGPVQLNNSRTITLNGAATLTLANLVNTQAGNPTLTVTAGTGNNLVIGSLDLSNSANSRTVTISGTANTTVTGAIANGGTATASALIFSGAGTLTLQGNNTYSGNTTVSAGALVLADNAQLKFVLGATSGTNNSISGAGTVTLNGDFVIDTTAADALASGTWTLENVGSLAGPYGSTFTVVGFTDAGSDKWTKSIGGGKTYTFDETTGILTLATVVGGYSSWATTNGIPGEPFGGDFNNDGISNGVAYALGLSPTASSQPAGTLSGNTITFTKGTEAIANDDVTWIIETSETLQAGSWTDAVTQANTNNDPAISYTFTPGTPVKKFARLKAVKAP